MDRSTYSPPSSPRLGTTTITSSGLIQGRQKVESKKKEVEAKARQAEERTEKLRRQKLEEYNRLHVDVQARKKRFEMGGAGQAGESGLHGAGISGRNIR
ncbi:hypothetical protein QCA50_014284 [Cerrena zonata]|uniref:Uncharacterized protein n=1 Tax=Cerrena zonata TaxID=2478898 RepID=A0AAW0FSG1_9APHY